MNDHRPPLVDTNPPGLGSGRFLSSPTVYVRLRPSSTPPLPLQLPPPPPESASFELLSDITDCIHCTHCTHCTFCTNSADIYDKLRHPATPSLQSRPVDGSCHTRLIYPLPRRRHRCRRRRYRHRQPHGVDSLRQFAARRIPRRSVSFTFPPSRAGQDLADSLQNIHTIRERPK